MIVLNQTNTKTKKDKKPKSRWRWLKRIVIVLVILTASLYGVFYYYTQPHIIAAYADNILERETQAVVQVESGHLHGLSKLTLKNIHFDAPGLKHGAQKLFSAESIDIHFDIWDIIAGKYEAQRIELTKPHLYLTDHRDYNIFNYTFMQRIRDKTPTSTKVDNLPEVFVHNARIIYGEVLNKQYKVIGDKLALNGGLTNTDTQNKTYTFKLKQYFPDTRPNIAHPDPITISGSFNPETLVSKVILKDLSVSKSQELSLPLFIRNWLESLQPAGRLSELILSYDPEAGPEAKVQINDLALTLPPLSKGEYVARLHEVNASLTFNNAGVNIHKLNGEIEGIRYDISGVITGYSPDSPFKLAIATDPFSIPDQPRYLVGLPEDVQRIFSILTPVGVIQANLTLHKDSPTDKIMYNGSAQILSGSGGHFEFPYILQQCKGLIRFNQDQLEIVNLTGKTNGEGTATLTGTITPPGPDGELDIVVTAVDIPFDDYLGSCFDDDIKPVYDTFFNRQSEENLLDQNLIITPDEKNDLESRSLKIRTQLKLDRENNLTPQQINDLEDELQRINDRLKIPAFEVGGHGDVVVNIYKPNGKDEKPQVTATVDVKESFNIVSLFPYPVIARGGKLYADKNQVRFEKISLKGLNGAKGYIDGVVKLETIDGETNPMPDVNVVGIGAPVKGLLLQALPEKYAEQINFIQYDGNVDANAHILTTKENKPSFKVLIEAKDGKCEPRNSNYPIEKLLGEVHVQPGSIKLVNFTGQHDQTQFTLNTNILIPDDETLDPDIKLNLTTTDAQLNQNLFSLITSLKQQWLPEINLNPASDDKPLTITQLYEKYQPSGTLNAQLSIDTLAPENQTYQLNLQPQSFSLLWNETTPLEFNQMSGDIAVSPTRFMWNNLSATTEQTTFNATGQYSPESKTITLTGTANAPQIPTHLQPLIPDSLNNILNRTKLKSGWSLTLNEFNMTNLTADQPTYDLNGFLKLTDAQGDLGITLANTNADIVFDVQSQPDTTYPNLKLDITAPTAQIQSRLTTELNLSLDNATDNKTLSVKKVAGKMYSGAFLGDGQLNMDTQNYNLQITLSDVNVTKFMTADPAITNTPSNANFPITGKLALNLSLEGSVGQSNKSRGRGELLIHSGTIYELPISMGFFNLTYLKLPQSQSFDQALLNYYITGNTVNIESLRLSPKNKQGLKLIGRGRVNYLTQDVNLELTTTTARSQKLGPVDELVNKLRNQIATIYITGKLRNPDIKVRSFDGVIRAWNDVFKPEDNNAP